MGKIVLEGMEFFAHHGYSDEEQKIGNKYGVDIYIGVDIEKAMSTDHLADTVDYSVVYAITAQEMAVKSRLLENIGHRILRAVKAKYSQINQIEIHISKYNPPVGGVVYRSKIILQESFH